MAVALIAAMAATVATAVVVFAIKPPWQVELNPI